MNLALAISSLTCGGAERVLSMLANYWADHGATVTVITIDAESTDFYQLDPRIRRVALAMMRDSPGLGGALKNNYKRIRALRKVLADVEPETLLSFGSATNVLVLIAKLALGIRCVISERTDPTLNKMAATWELLRRLIYPLTDALVVQTASLLPWARRIVGPNRAHVIANPVRDMRHFARVHLEQPAHFAIAVGRLQPVKGFDILLAAFARIAFEFANWTVVILGEGPEHPSLRHSAEKLGIADRVFFLGRVEEPGELMAVASLFVMSSRCEGFPNALLEAMACGLASISTNCRGPAEIINEGTDGLLVPVDDVLELATAMSKLMRDAQLRETLGHNALTVRERYTLESIASRWEILLQGDWLPQATA